ncbi:MAG: hypothetical protein GKR88_15065 [Flavobacteriaceae bacterium]|nr:MAG: hypothetical protein GKR88_15065 [Flavobacteriaceae bacterium]
MIKKIFLLIIGVCVLLIVGFYIITGGKGTYKLSEGIGYSRTIEASKKRGVFVKELDYKIIPDSIQLAKDKVFFVEKGFRYGKYSAKKTLPLRETDDYTYRIGMSPASGEIFSGSFLLGYGDSFHFHKIKDTIRREIVTKKPPYDSIYKVGELFLFEKKPSKGN